MRVCAVFLAMVAVDFCDLAVAVYNSGTLTEGDRLALGAVGQSGFLLYL